MGTGSTADGAAQFVLSRDQHDPTGPLVRRRITRTYQRTAYALQVLTLGDGQGNEQVIRTTDEHPFYVPGVGWVRAGDLIAGQQLTEADGTTDATILSTAREEHPEGIKVYNLSVGLDHTFYVADAAGSPTAVWVHNAGLACSPPNPFGKVGDLVTQRTARAVERMLIEAKFTQITREVRFIKGAGALKNRFVDVVGVNPTTGQRVLVQIGKLSRKFPTLPVAREGEALRDIVRSPTFRRTDILLFIQKGSIK